MINKKTVFSLKPWSMDLAVTCAMTLLYSNSSLNPILYCWKIKDVRRAMKTTVRSLFGLLTELVN